MDGGIAPMVRQRQCVRRGPVPGRPLAHAPGSPGQTLVEFALVLGLLLLVTVGLIDGLRVIFYYSQVQDAARQGARWGAVQVDRAIPGSNATVGGTLSLPGNAPGTYCDAPGASTTCPSGATSLSGSLVVSTGALTPTIAGATMRAATAVNPAQATVTISTTIPATATTETAQTDPLFTDQAVTVTVTYPFTPVLGIVFHGLAIRVTGTSSMLHE